MNIEEEFVRSMDQLRFSAGTKDLMCQKLIYMESEGNAMKKQTIRKTAAVLAVCALALGVTAFGAARSGILYGWSNGEYDFHTPEEAVASEDFAKAANVPESLAGGFTFDGGETMHSSDEAGNKWEELYLIYKDKAGREVSMFLQEAGEDQTDREPTDVKEIRGIQVQYNQDEYLVIPENYELSEDLRERERTDDHFFISEGSEEPENYTYRSIWFEKDGTSCHLQTSDDVKAAELFAMASEIIG